MSNSSVTKADLVKAVEGFADVATEAEMQVMGNLIGLQLMKAVFMRRARPMGMSAEQIDACRREIQDEEKRVFALVQLLNETDAEAQALTQTAH